MTINSILKEKVLQLKKGGHGRNEIARLLTQQGSPISEGSVGNIIRAHRPPKTDVESSLLNTTTDINETGSPSSIGDGLADSEGLDIDFSDIPYPESYPNPNIEPAAIINQDVPQQNDTTEEESSKANQSINTLSGAENQSGLEPLLIPDWNPDDSHETILWKRIMAEKKQRQQEYQIIQRERRMLEGERRQIMQLKTNMEQQQKDLQIREQKLVDIFHL